MNADGGSEIKNQITGVSGRAGAIIIADQVDTGGIVLTLAQAVVDILIAIFASPTFLAFALVIAVQVLT